MKINVKYISAIILICFLLQSCTKNSEKVYFIHAIGFDNAGKNMAISAVSQTQNSQNSTNNSSNFEVLRFEGKTTKECFDKLLEFCKNTYLGSSEIYFLSTGLTKENLDDICKYVCFEPNLPSKSIVCAIDSESTFDFLKKAKNENFFQEIKNILNNQKINVVSFLGKSYQGNVTCFLPLISYYEKPINSGTVKCKNNHFEVR